MPYADFYEANNVTVQNINFYNLAV